MLLSNQKSNHKNSTTEGRNFICQDAQQLHITALGAQWSIARHKVMYLHLPNAFYICSYSHLHFFFYLLNVFSERMCLTDSMAASVVKALLNHQGIPGTCSFERKSSSPGQRYWHSQARVIHQEHSARI